MFYSALSKQTWLILLVALAKLVVVLTERNME